MRTLTESTWRRLLLAALLAVFSGRIALTYRIFNDTFDEVSHITAGLEVLQRRSYTIEAQHPPLARVVVALLPYYFAGLRMTPFNELWGHGPWAQRDLAFYWRSLALARAGNLLFVVILFYFIYRWSSMLFGPRAGVMALVLAVCCPTLLAHAGLATLDIGATATILMAAYFFWRWSEQPGWRYCLASAVAFSLAALAKFSALVFLPPLAVIFFLVARWRRSPTPSKASILAGASRGAAFALVVLLCLWTGYGFESNQVVPPGHRVAGPFLMGGERSLPNLLLKLLGARRLPAPQLARGVIDVAAHNLEGHSAYLLGHVSQRGWWYYFPVAVAVKATIPMLLLAAIGVVAARRKAIHPLAAVLVIMGLSLPAGINIGVRHVLPAFPFLAILAAGAFYSRRPAVRVAAVLLVASHVAESARAHPDYLAYFNQIAHGRGERFLLDSNLDWGQDLARLGRYLQEHHIEWVYLSYFGRSSAAKMGVNAKDLPPDKPTRGWVAVSLSNLMMKPELAWLRDRKPAARVGKSIWLYYLGP